MDGSGDEGGFGKAIEAVAGEEESREARVEGD